MSDLERELEEELHRVLDPMMAQPIPPRRALSSQAATRKLLGGAGAALGVKLLTGVAVAAAAVTVAGAATTGSINPVVWGQTVTKTVTDCKAKLSDGQHGIGDCVSDIASTHGQAVASDARHHGNGNGNGNGAANAHGNNPNANDHAKNKTKGHGTQTKGGSGQQDSTDPAAHANVTPTPLP